jgi:ubiquinone/menaquinone biosynthesis C-methylase UbiE
MWHTAYVPAERDVAAFDSRALSYEEGWLGRLHREIADRAIEVALAARPSPRRVLDVGCGSGYLLRTLANQCGSAERFTGVDPSDAMIVVASAHSNDPRVGFETGMAERLRFDDATFDLIVSTTSFDHWVDQFAGLKECARVLETGGRFVLMDLFSAWLTPTLVARRHKARTKHRAERVLLAAGFRSPTWHRGTAVIINAVTATV